MAAGMTAYCLPERVPVDGNLLGALDDPRAQGELSVIVVPAGNGPSSVLAVEASTGRSSAPRSVQRNGVRREVRRRAPS